jgi:transcriptional regulator with XRE-family HTH domain
VALLKVKTTGDLREELMTQADIDTYIKENKAYFFTKSTATLLTELYEEKSLTKAALARKAGMSEVYLHQVFSGRRKPSRDRLLCLCIGLGATLEETQRLLKQAGYAQIYPKVKRDAIISHGIVHHAELSEINDKLFVENEKTLC